MLHVCHIDLSKIKPGKGMQSDGGGVFPGLS